MVQRTVTQITDDLDGTPGARSVTFALEGASYSIDLSEVNLARLREALAPFIENAVREGAADGRRASSVGTWRREDLQEWAKARGYRVGDRGRVPQGIVDEYLSTR
ncbi:Lsr2 family protein [Microbacterium sp. 1P10UB]|uniref:histone-like nucleoid-structuring protein Lsr2 n=1 Tax=unclassified Microbacterium TaxID=2609290 RepID=UPI0039A21357